MKAKIVIAGGSGFVGQLLSEHFRKGSYEVIVLSRGAQKSKNEIKYIQWDGKTVGPWVEELEGSEAVINLTGKSVNCRPTPSNKKEIITSRVDSTEVIGKAIGQCKTPPKVWINAGGVGVFSGTGRSSNDENAPLGTDFTAEVARLWEDAFMKADTPLTRKVFLRIALVLKKGEGFLQPMELLVKTGMGGTMGSGKQHFPWIHFEDLIRVFDYVLQQPDMDGIVHGVSPQAVTNASFMRQLRQIIGVPFGIPAPGFAVKMGAFLIGTNGSLALSDNHAIPGKLNTVGFTFKFPDLASALRNLYTR